MSGAYMNIRRKKKVRNFVNRLRIGPVQRILCRCGRNLGKSMVGIRTYVF